MSRSRNNTQGTPVSLFPFLAVLLCTMGALVILLVAMAHVTRQQAEAGQAVEATAAMEPAIEPLPPSPTAPTDEELAASEQRRAQLQTVAEQVVKLEQKNQEVDDALRDSHLHLSQVEGHINRLTDHLKSLRAAIFELQQEDAEHYDDRAQAERNLAQLEQLIEDTKQEIAELKAEQEGRFKAFAVVPYKGRNGTQRQPIYIECRADEVILQPEGVRLTPDDFRRPLGVGNPLAAALRASREYFARGNPDAGYDPDTEPYPLIIIRPDGIRQYYDVREAIRSWDSDFGYEMVGGDWDLKFPAPNPALHEVQSLAIEQSRIRRQMLAQAAPSAYGGGRGGLGVAGRRGSGGQPYDGRTLGPGGNRGNAPQAAAGRPIRQAQQGAGGGEAELFSGQNNAEDTVSGQAARAGEYAPDGATRSDAAGSLEALAGGQPGSPNQTPNADQAGTAATRSGQAALSNQQASAAGGAASGEAAADAGSTGAASRRLQFASRPPGGRRADWAVEKGAPTDIAIRRPVSVLVSRDQINVAGGAVVPLLGSTEGSLDEFVKRVQQQVRSWGIAGQGLYWRPVLKLNVAPDGADRAQDLARLLERSGIEIDYQQTAAAPDRGGADATR